MKLLPIEYPNLSETPLHRKLRQWKREDDHQRRERLRLWAEPQGESGTTARPDGRGESESRSGRQLDSGLHRRQCCR